MSKEVYLTSEEIQFLADWYITTRNSVSLAETATSNYKNLVETLDKKLKGK